MGHWKYSDCQCADAVAAGVDGNVFTSAFLLVTGC